MTPSFYTHSHPCSRSSSTMIPSRSPSYFSLSPIATAISWMTIIARSPMRACRWPPCVPQSSGDLEWTGNYGRNFLCNCCTGVVWVCGFSWIGTACDDVIEVCSYVKFLCSVLLSWVTKFFVISLLLNALICTFQEVGSETTNFFIGIA